MSIKFGETIRYDKHDSEKMTTDFEFIMLDCKTSGFEKSKFKSGECENQLAITLSEKHREMLDEIVARFEDNLEEEIIVNTPWKDSGILWVKVSDDVLVRTKPGKEESCPGNHIKPFTSHVAIFVSGLFVRKDTNKAFMQMKVVEVLIHEQKKKQRKPVF